MTSVYMWWHIESRLYISDLCIVTTDIQAQRSVSSVCSQKETACFMLVYVAVPSKDVQRDGNVTVPNTTRDYGWMVMDSLSLVDALISTWLVSGLQQILTRSKLLPSCSRHLTLISSMLNTRLGAKERQMLNL